MNANEIITGKIVNMLEKGIIPWHKPWIDGGMPMNLVSRKNYRGLNVFILNTTSLAMGYLSRYWLTYNQASAMGGNVRKGEKATPVIFWTFLERKDEDGNVSEYPFLRYYNVFNVEQCEKIEYPANNTIVKNDEPSSEADAIIFENTRLPEIEMIGNRAVYIPALDVIRLPKVEQFIGWNEFYNTAFHEMVHSTGHFSRLNRPEVQKPEFGSERYGKEELVAELGSAIMSGIMGISNDKLIENSTAYIQDWLKVLRNDKRFVISAAGAAQKAVDWILGTEYQTEAVEVAEEVA